jgi:hypothetical protein
MAISIPSSTQSDDVGADHRLLLGVVVEDGAGDPVAQPGGVLTNARRASTSS